MFEVGQPLRALLFLVRAMRPLPHTVPVLLRADHMTSDVSISTLSPFLLPIYELELELGNIVQRVDRNCWSNCPLSVVFRDPLHFHIALEELDIATCVSQWENRDPHYAIEAGWVCESSRHALSGPLPLKG